MTLTSMMQEQREKNDDRDRDTDQPEKQSFSETHDLSSFLKVSDQRDRSFSVP
ncbi:hypothetical protein DES32_2638 [Methylovirgula ligni]|uniref:Uncharacterized protein n=1 Tax=Methylovirgula ligni TaxID=569860 RepID=A0A3D9Z021_9HYPH|nr:hypothetical protein DES32_2638 [Methylovirgula ligni]